MNYMGSKRRITKFICPILQKCIDDYKIETYIEPCVGGANVIDKINCKNRYGYDINPELIALLSYVRDNPDIPIAPKDCTPEHYAEVRNSYRTKDGRYSSAYLGLIGFCASFGGKFWNGFARDRGGIRNHYDECVRNLKMQAPNLEGIQFGCLNLFETDEFANVQNSVIYFDPPYRNTTGYKNTNKFDYDKFYDLVLNLSKTNYVFVSEKFMPEQFRTIWEMPITIAVDSKRTAGEIMIEKLFVPIGGLSDIFIQ